MTRIWTEGWELGDLIGYTNLYSFISGTARSGSYGLLVSLVGYLTKNTPDLSEAYLRFGYYQTGNMLYLPIQVRWRHGTTVLGILKINSARILELYVGSTLVATGTTVLYSSTWYLIEIHIKIGNSPNGLLEVKLDGNAEFDYSDDTQPGADAHFDNLLFENPDGGSGANLYGYFDDMGLNDTAGGVDDSWCGEGKIIKITPMDDVTTELTQFPALTDHHNDVDDYPADSDTTYVEGSVVDEEDKYELTASGLVAADVASINRVWCEARSKNTTANPGEVALFIYSDATEGTGTDVVLSASYVTKVMSQEFLQDPDGPAAWSVAALDALQGGIRTRD